MIGAFLTSLFWALSAVTGQRAAWFLGSLRANVVRLSIALLLLGLITLILYPGSFGARSSTWLFVSGIVGFGFGDVGLYMAYTRIGSRVTVLITFCLAPVFAALAEWIWLGVWIPWTQALAALTILIGVGMALKPTSAVTERSGNFGLGVLMALIAASGQGLGAVISRVANEVATEELGSVIPGLSQAFQRVAGGLLVAAIAVLIARQVKPKQIHAYWTQKSVAWLLGTTLCGPVIGVTFYQWALKTTESAIVLAIVALTPIFVMPLAFFVERDRPTKKAIVGALIAVGGMIAVGWLRYG